MEQSMSEIKLDTDYMFVCGYAGSGKSLYAKFLAEKFGANFIEVSDIVKELTNEKDRSDIGYRPDLDDLIIERLDEMSLPVVVSGVRQLKILKAFERSPVVWVHVSKEMRQARMNSRGEAEDNLSVEECDALDNKLGLNDIKEYIARKENI